MIQKSHRVAIPGIKSPTEVLWSLSRSPTPVDQPDVVIEKAMGEMVERKAKKR